MPDPRLVDRFRRDLHAVLDRSATPQDRFAVAVSGGADSLALLLLAHAALPGRIAAVSVDHGLRAGAAAECAFVGETCGALGVAHETLAVVVTPEGEGMQAAARVARRRAWREWATAKGLSWVLTGHHADDQAETVLMRLARGSGVGGLAGIPRLGRLGGSAQALIHLVRPLLCWRRAELGAIVEASGLTAVVDPSNADPAYDRTRARRLLASSDFLHPMRLAAAADHARDADDAVEWIVQQLAGHIRAEDGQVRLVLQSWPREVLRRLVLEAMAELGAYPDDGAQVERLITSLHAGRTATLAGIKAVPGDGIWSFSPAPPHRSP